MPKLPKPSPRKARAIVTAGLGASAGLAYIFPAATLEVLIVNTLVNLFWVWET
jgi:hypothetical protein